MMWDDDRMITQILMGVSCNETWQWKMHHLYGMRPRSIAKLANIFPMSLWFVLLMTSVTGAYNPTYNLGSTLHCRSGFPSYKPPLVREIPSLPCLVTGGNNLNLESGGNNENYYPPPEILLVN